MSKKEIASELKHYLKLYAIAQDKQYLDGILIYAGMLAGAEL